LHCPFGPHWAFALHVPHVPATHACPPPHWLLDVQAVQTPLTQPKLPLDLGGMNGFELQSSKDEHGPQTLFTQACPFGQYCPGPINQQPVTLPTEQTPEAHVSPDAQSESAEHVH
jgi:hypothetical protein